MVSNNKHGANNDITKLAHYSNDIRKDIILPQIHILPHFYLYISVLAKVFTLLLRIINLQTKVATFDIIQKHI